MSFSTKHHEKYQYTFLISLVFILTLCCLVSSFYYLYHIQKTCGDPIRSDGLGYYSYLPAIFKYHDLSFSFLGADSSIAGVYVNSSGHVINKYPIGTAILQSPFYFVADIICNLLPDYPTDGFSSPYQYAIIASTSFYFIVGLYILIKILKKYFSVKIVLLTTICMVWGTNLFHYATFDASFSHIYSFFSITVFIFLTDLIENKNSCLWFHHLALGILAGIIGAIRNPNIVILCYYIFYNVTSFQSFKKRLKKILMPTRLLFNLAGLLAGGGLQCVYWYTATGQFLVRSYDTTETFSWLFPHVIAVLSSVSKGMIFYSPILALALLGMILLRKYHLSSLSIILTVMLHFYITSCWDQWQYGGSFGQRPFVDFYGLYALLLGCMLTFLDSLVMP